MLCHNLLTITTPTNLYMPMENCPLEASFPSYSQEIYPSFMELKLFLDFPSDDGDKTYPYFKSF
jgi:hypothetical protein